MSFVKWMIESLNNEIIDGEIILTGLVDIRQTDAEVVEYSDLDHQSQDIVKHRSKEPDPRPIGKRTY